VHILRGNLGCGTGWGWEKGSIMILAGRGAVCVVYWSGVWAGRFCERGGSGGGREGSEHTPLRGRGAIKSS